ncbi:MULTISPECIES: hypothetical protein [unclassified Brucella]|uniref:hypothetical protein n=1 Tax=unclassified Brucella TaxID=2632610 RepID=UPI000972C53E|nr:MULTISPECIES: hypothetical protein [unclassified Brucella]APX68359.1 hypothetical protein BKD03_02620 [Brucella sp. 09RB8471]MRN77870.1 hypothetical protein [Brucella sp. 10RB9210]
MVAIVLFLFLSGRTIATSMGVVKPGAIGPAPQGLERSERRLAAAFLFRAAKPKAAEKSWRRTLRETSEAKPVIGQTHADRVRGWSACFRKLREYGNGGYVRAVTLENGIGLGFVDPLCRVIFTVMAPCRLPVGCDGHSALPSAPSQY